MTVSQFPLSHPKYRPDIDGLRAVAVLAVVAFHAFPNWINGGFIGVDIFFVISGYLISTIIFENLDRGSFSFATFYARRIKRIFPALLFILLVCFTFGWFALLADEFKQLGKHIAAGASFISNLVLWHEAGYFDNAAETKPLLHLWSLGIEEQFYAVWPLLLWLAWRQKFNLFKLTVLIVIVSFILNIKGIEHDTVATFYSPQTRFWELLTGSLLAWTTVYNQRTLIQIKKTDSFIAAVLQIIGDKALSNLFSITGLGLLAYGIWHFNRELSFPGQWALIPVLGAALIITAGAQAWLNRTILSNQIAVWVGLISFPLYLWHWPLLSFARILESDTPSLNLRIAAVICAIVLAWLTYQFVERPIRFGQNDKTKVTILILLMTILGAIGYTTYAKNGLPLRSALSNVSPIIERLKEDDPELHAICLKAYGLSNHNIRYCRLSTIDHTKPRIALIGDSHAAALFSGLSKALSYSHEGLLMIGGRLFIDVAAYPEGDKFEIENYQGGIFATNFVAKEKSIDTVIMVSRGPGYINGDSKFYVLDQPHITDRRQVFEIGMRRTLDLMIAHQKKVIFVLDNPEVDFDPEKCQTMRPLSIKRNFDCTISRASFDARQQDYRALVFNVLKDYPSVVLFDQAAYFCDKVLCRFKDGATVLYGDGDHLSVRGAEFMGAKLVDVLNGTPPKLLE